MNRKISNQDKNFKVLLVYPNIQQCAMMPSSIGLFTSLLKNNGFSVDLFDCTFYIDDSNANFDKYQTFVQEFDWGEKSKNFKKDMINDFINKVSDTEPDLIAISVVENTYPIGRNLIKSLPSRLKDIPKIWGGVFATFAPQIILNDNVGNFVCRGEGEVALINLCNKLYQGESTNKIPNLWVKDNGSITKNQMGPIVNLNELPIPDYSLFDDHAIYRPMQGKIRRAIGIETMRGCPYTCTYCNSPSQVTVHKEETGESFFRKKTIEKVREEIEYLHKLYNLELIFFIDDTFLAISKNRFEEFTTMYSDFKIPFWMNTRCETMTEYRAEKLDEINMLRMNFGIEHGNYDYRKNFLKRTLTNEQMINAFNMTSGKNYVTVGNCIVGMPEENRKLIMDTIEFTRMLPIDIEKTGAFIFAPYHGTGLREIAIRKNYLKDPNSICDIRYPETSMLDQPQLRKKEVIGLARCFGLYQTLPKSKWKWIEKAEQDNKEGAKIRKDLVQDYHDITMKIDKKVRKNSVPQQRSAFVSSLMEMPNGDIK